MSFELLSTPIRKFIRDQGWEQLRPIQAAAINHIMASDGHFILASRTASGKTEAAFLPILSKVDCNLPGVQVLYISPLIALINDQFYRIEQLCKNLDIPVTKWHGEANKKLKDDLLKQPRGIVLITPESLEAMFVNKPFNVKQLFSNLKYAVIDEIHSFIGTDRGVQLKSILSRLQRINTGTYSIVGLSATLGDFNEAKKFTGDEQKTKVLRDTKGKDINAQFRYFKREGDELPLDLLKNLYQETKNNKVLIFPNSRGLAEEVAVKLKKISDKVKGHPNYFSHHSSVDREVREYVEFFAKNNKRQNFCISCTSTLELGIDIGTVDQVVQIDAAHSIASLIQRVGRSGRREGESSNLFLYATNQWSLLQSAACWLLYQEGFVEPPEKNEQPYDILLHQALSITKGYSGIPLKELATQLKENAAFSGVEPAAAEEILEHLIQTDLLEKIQQEVIIGVEGEKVVNSRDFYSVFKTAENFKVMHAGNKIGEIPFSWQTAEDENILLAARIWKIKLVDEKAKRIEVIPANDGKKPIFSGGQGDIHPRVREKMLEILSSGQEYDFLDQPGLNEIAAMRREFAVFNIQNLQTERPLLLKSQHLELFTFTGTRINRTLQLLLNAAGIKCLHNDKDSSFIIDASGEELLAKWNLLAEALADTDMYIRNQLLATPDGLSFSKWGRYLPAKYQVMLLKGKYFDLQQTAIFLATVNLVKNA